MLSAVSIRDASPDKFSQLFAKINIIRIVVRDGGGLGNEAAAITVINRLRDLGYQNRIELVYEDIEANIKKYPETLGKLLKGFDPFGSNYQELPDNIAVRGLDFENELHDLEFAPICICGASDRPIFSCDYIKYHAGCIVSLQPTAFNTCSKRSIYLPDSENPSTLAFNGVLFARNTVMDDKAPIDSADRFFKTLLLRSERKDIYFQSVYGLAPEVYSKRNTYEGLWPVLTGFSNPVIEMFVVAEAVLNAQESYKKPTVILVHSPLEDDCFDRLKRILPQLKNHSSNPIQLIYDGDTEQALETMNSLKNNEILIYATGQLEKALFERLMLSSNLPPIAEGANTTTMLEAYGRPYLHGGRCEHSAVEKLSEDTLSKNNISSELQALHTNANARLETAAFGKSREVKEFIEKALNGELKQYFELRKNIFLERQDDIATALNYLTTQKLAHTEIEAIVKFSGEMISLLGDYYNIVNKERPDKDSDDLFQKLKNFLIPHMDEKLAITMILKRIATMILANADTLTSKNEEELSVTKFITHWECLYNYMQKLNEKAIDNDLENLHKTMESFAKKPRPSK
ncbi:MAG: hypothetical protein ABIH77_05005 [Pseudomonadota bacterium]|nr:hypothetical protein [Gammaproteobacteria bacterium]